jgi:uncharacterized protein involved in exopolysaccharide biosynthesis
MFVRQAAPGAPGETAPAASPSWENPVPAQNPNGDGELIKGSLTRARVTDFTRRNGYKTLSLALILFMIGLAVLSILPVRYSATALVVVDPREERVTNEQDVLPGIGQDSAALQSLIEIAKSDGFLLPLIEQLKVAEDSDIAGGETDPSKILEKFRKRLDISRRGLTYVIAMTVVSNRPTQAARYANAIADAFVASQTQARTDATEGASGFLNSRLKTLSDRLRASEDAVATFKSEHRIVNAGRESTTRQLRVTELSQQVSAAKLRAEDAKNRFEQAQRDLKINVEVPSGSRTDILTVLRAQRTQLNDQIAQKRAVLGDRHPDLVIANSQLAELNRQIEAERKRAVDGAKSDYETALEQQRSLEKQLKAQEGEMLQDGQAAVKLQELQRDAEANKNIYEQFLSRFKTTNEQRLFQKTQTKVVSAATPPTRSTRPPLMLILAGLAIGSLLSATAIVMLLDAIPSRQALSVASADATPAKLAPKQDTKTPAAILAHARRGAEQRPVSRPPPRLEPLKGLHSHAQELLDSMQPGQRGRLVLVTTGESDAGDGAAARALNASAVQRGMLSVLIEVTPKEALFRQPAADPGMTGNGGRVLRTDAQSVIQLLDAGPNVGGSTYPGDVRAEFDLIIVSAPSPAEHGDVAAISALCDHTIIVAREGNSQAPVVNRAKAAVARSGNSTITVVADDSRGADKPASGMVPTGRRDRTRLAV